MERRKDGKIATAIKSLASEYLEAESNRQSLITVTRVEVLNKGKRVSVFFTVFPDSEEDKALEFVRRKRKDFKMFVGSKKIFGFVPSIEFQIDYGEKNRQRIDSLLSDQ